MKAAKSILDRALSVMLIVGGAMLWIAAQGIPNERAHDPLGARFFPELVGIALVLAGFGVLGQGLVARVRNGRRIPDEALGAGQAGPRAQPTADTTARPPSLWGDRVRLLYEGGVVPVMGLAVLYLVALPWAGYVVSTIAAIVALLAVLGITRIRTLVLLSIGTTFAIYALFTYVLRIRLP